MEPLSDVLQKVRSVIIKTAPPNSILKIPKDFQKSN